MDDVVAKTAESLKEHLRLLQDGREIDPAVKLTEYGLDSMKAIDILLSLESGFGITFPDKMLSESTFSTLTSLSEAVQLVLDIQE